MSEPTLAQIAEAVADGETVDWDSVRARLTTPGDQALAAQLQTLSAIHAGQDYRRPADLPLHTGISRLLHIVIGLAAAASAAAAVGTLLGASLTVRSSLLLLVVIAFGGMGLVLGPGTRDPRVFALSGVYWTIAASFAASGVYRVTAFVTTGMTLAVLRAMRPEAFLPAFLWQFTRLFPSVVRFGLLDRVCRVLFLFSLTMGIGLFAANILPACLPDAGAWLRSVERMRGTGPVFWAIVFGLTLPALVVIPFRARRATRLERRRVLLFVSGIAAGLGPVVTLVLLESLWLWFGRLMQQPAAQWWGAWVVYPPILAMPAMTAYAVTVHGVFSLRVVVRNRLRHLLASSLVAWSTATAAIVLALYGYVHRDQPITQLLAAPRARVLVSIIAAGLALLLWVRGWLMHLIDQWLTPGAEEPSTLLAQLADALRRGRTPQELATAFSAVVSRALNTSAQVYLIADGTRLVSATGVPAWTRVDSLIPVLVAGAHGPCIVDPNHRASYYGLLHEGDRRWIDDHQIGVLVPLSAGHRPSTPFAIVALRSGSDAFMFSREDLRFLITASASVSFALDALQASGGGRDAVQIEELALQCRRCQRVEARERAGDQCSCGGAWETAGLPRVLLDRFVLDALLGAGGMGLVYRATDRVLERTVAVKTLPALVGDAAERLLTEARTMAALSHPHVAVLYGTEMWRGTPVLFMEHLAGGTLAALLRRGPLDAGAAHALALTLGRTLEHVHAAGRYHGDIKPSNIGLTADRVPKFLDFGLSQAFEEGGGRLAGTLPYLSPEVLRGEAPGPGLDVWALCVVLFESLTGVHPFLDGSRTRAHILRGLDGVVPGGRASLDPDLASFFHHALAADPRQRPGSAAAFVHTLSSLERP